MAFVLKLLGPKPVRLRVERGVVVTVGRSKEAGLAIDDKLISRFHLELEVGKAGLVVRDLQSRNGSTLNGQKFTGEVTVRPGDQLGVGSAVLLVEGEVDSKSRSGERADLPLIPGYELLALLSKGESCKVYRGRAVDTGRAVAVKVLDEDAGETDRLRFERSARVLERLDHPNIVRVLEVASDEACPFYAMEYLEGSFLSERLKKGPLPLREALGIAVQVARALGLLHAEDVIHRSIAPASILCLRGGVAKLLGFGAAKLVDSGTPTLTSLGEIVGDVSYSSPEQVQDPRGVDHRSDLYALGAVLFHMLAGRPPLQGKSPIETFRIVLSVPAPPLRAVAPQVPLAVEALVAKLLEKEPARRPATAVAVLRMLEEVVAQASAAAATPAAGSGEAPAVGGSFAGAFMDAELLEIVQFLELHKKSGVLVVEAGALRGEIRLKEGALASAAVGVLDGTAAALELLQAPEGRFRFQVSPDPPRGAGAGTSPSALALEVLRCRDEVARRT